MMVRDDLLALDYLAARPEVDPRRIAATGMSMGSTRSWWLAALDDRVAAAACVACLTRGPGTARARRAPAARDLLLRAGPAPAFRQRGGAEPDRAAAAADADRRPRRRARPAEGVRAIHRTCARVYRLYGARRRFAGVLLPGVGHVYTPAMFRRVLAWLDTHLRRGTGLSADARR